MQNRNMREPCVQLPEIAALQRTGGQGYHQKWFSRMRTAPYANFKCMAKRHHLPCDAES